MRIVNFKAENFKILKAIEISPSGDVVKIGGKNGQGKSSVLDAIWVTLAGRGVGPAMLIRKGEEECRLQLDTGELIITRKFTAKEGGQMTDSIKVQRQNGDIVSKPQNVLNELMGQIGFDPFAFVSLKPDAQAETLLAMVPLPIDLDADAEADATDFATRRDLNRDAAALKAQIDAIQTRDDLPADAPDRSALTAKLASAADTNSAIERERARRLELTNVIQRRIDDCERDLERVKQLRAEADALAANITERANGTDERQAELEALPPLGDPVDTAAVRAELESAEAILAAIDQQKRRADLVTRHAALVEQADARTKAMVDREKVRNEALGKAKMPIDGLGFAVNDKGKPVVMFNGIPFDQASTAEQIKASTAIAMAGNPELRVLRIKDGSLLDEDSLAIIAGMARDEDFQLWIEVVGTGGVGVVIENGEIKPAAEEKPDGALL